MFKNRLKTYKFVPPLLRNCLTLLTFPFLVIISTRTVVLAIVFYCLGHSIKNVYDDDDDDAKIAQRIGSQPYAKLYNNIPFHVPHLNPCEIVPHFPVPHFHVSHFQRPRLSVCYTHLYIRQPMDSKTCPIAILFKLNASLPALVVKSRTDNISTINIMQLLSYKRVSYMKRFLLSSVARFLCSITWPNSRKYCEPRFGLMNKVYCTELQLPCTTE